MVDIFHLFYIIIFIFSVSGTKVTAHRLKILFGLAGLKAAELHGNISQDQRLHVSNLCVWMDSLFVWLVCIYISKPVEYLFYYYYFSSYYFLGKHFPLVVVSDLTYLLLFV